MATLNTENDIATALSLLNRLHYLRLTEDRMRVGQRYISMFCDPHYVNGDLFYERRDEVALRKIYDHLKEREDLPITLKKIETQITIERMRKKR